MHHVASMFHALRTEMNKTRADVKTELGAMKESAAAVAAETRADVKALDQKVATLAADHTRVQVAMDEFDRIRQEISSGRQTTEMWLGIMRGAKVDPLVWDSIFFPLRNLSQYHILWTALWKHFDSLALDDPYFSGVLSELRTNRVFASESETQALFNQAIPWLIAELDKMQIGLEIAFRDTSLKHAPSPPPHKFDMSFVYKDSSSTNADFQVLWNDLVMTGQLKRDLDENKDRSGALLQVSDGFCELRSQQKTRNREVAFISDARMFQAFVRTSVRGTDKVFTSGQLPLFTPNQDHASSGFISLVNVLIASAKALGFSPDSVASARVPTLPDRFLDDGATCAPHRIGHVTKPDVFFINQVGGMLFLPILALILE